MIKRKICVYGAGFTNKGAEAMLKTLRLHTKKDTLLNVFVDFGSDLKEKVDKSEYNLILNPIGAKEHIKFFFLAVLYKLFKYKSKYSGNFQALENSEEVIDLSGFALTDDFSKNSGTYRSGIFLIQAIISKLIFRKKYYIYPQAFGPYKRYFNYLISKLIVLLSDKVFIRGRRSFEYLNCKSKKCIQTSDFVFSKLFKEKYAYSVNIPYDNYIVINPNSRIYHKEKKRQETTYVDFLVKLVDYNLQKGYNVVLTPNEIRENEEDDLFICNFIKQKFESINVFVNKNLDLTYLLNLLGKARLSIVSRFHLMIFSLIMTKPLIVLSWADKYLDIMEEFSLEKYCLKNYNDTYTLIDEVIQKEVDLSSKISEQLINIEINNIKVIYE